MQRTVLKLTAVFALAVLLSTVAVYALPKVQPNVIVTHILGPAWGDREGEVEVVAFHNIVTNAGMNWTQYKLSGTGTDIASDYAKYIALTNHTGAASYTNTTLSSEITTGGLARGAGTFTAGSASAGDVTYYVYYNFTATAANAGIHRAGLFTKSSGGVLYAEGVLTSDVNVESGDKLNVQWTVTHTN